MTGRETSLKSFGLFFLKTTASPNHMAYKIINEIVVLSDGQEAIDYLFCVGKYKSRDTNDKPIITLLDINLPKLNGIEVLKRVRENSSTKYLPIVILTSSNEEKDIIDSYKLYANSYIRKPVDFIQFTDVVKQLGMYWLLNESMPKDL